MFKSLTRQSLSRLGCLHHTFSNLEKISLDWEYFLNPSNHSEILVNAERRGIGKFVTTLLDNIKTKLNSVDKNLNIENTLIDHELRNQIQRLPNKTLKRVCENLTEEPVLLENVGQKMEFSYFPATFDNIVKKLNLNRHRYLGHISGPKSYFLKHDLARLERALVKFTVHNLLKRGFILVSVPDILNKSILHRCGMNTEGEHSQVFHIDEKWGKDLCLSGTSEMALAAFCASKTFPIEKLPLKLCSVSRCYRAEAKNRMTEKGIFRVRVFTKVEMFALTTAEKGDCESEEQMSEFIEIQKDLFGQLGLHFKILEMPMCDLGLPAYHKVDIEAWMPGRGIYGEISSTSNCTDYQTRRLNIKYVSPSASNNQFCHSVNGTACAIPRMLIALIESFQNLNGSVNIPMVLQPYFGKAVIDEQFKETLRCMKPSG